MGNSMMDIRRRIAMNQPHIVTPAQADVVTFNTDMAVPLKKLKVSVEPVQDLHGYDNPWPAGGGKNKLPNENGTYKGTTGNNIYIVDSESPVSLPAGTYYIKYFADKSTGLALAGFYLSINGGTASRVGTNHATQETVESFVLAEQSNITLRLYSSTTGFNEAKYRFMLTVEDSTNIAFSPYSNICPISGFDGLTVTRAGKNLYDISRQTVTNDNTFLGVSPKPNTDYVFSTDKAITGLYVAYSDDETMPGQSQSTGWTNLKTVYNNTFLSFNSGSHKWLRLMTYESGGRKERTLQLELGTTAATDYEPYQGETYDIAFPSEAGTVYGGELDVTTGVLTVDRASVVFDGSFNPGLTNWRMFADSSAWLYRPIATPGIRNVVSNSTILSDKLETIPYPAAEGGIYADNIGIALVGTNDWAVAMRVPVAGLSDNASVNAWLSENPITLIYPLAEPITYTLTASQITTLLGTNNVWSDAGNVKLSYWTHIH